MNRICREPSGAATFWRLLLAACAAVLGLNVSIAANVTLKTSDANNTTSFTGSTNWNPVGVPTAGNAYFTGANTLRTTNSNTSGLSVNFGGDSLTVDAGGRILGKIGNNVGNSTAVVTNTVNNLILNGGQIVQAGTTADDVTLVVAGNISVNVASAIGATGVLTNGAAHFEKLEIVAPISGSAALQVSGPTVNGGNSAGVVRLSAANPYSGTITVSSATTDSINFFVGSTTNRMLQLNNLNALSNATLNLNDPQSNLVSFAAAANTGSFNVGALTGSSSQALVDTAGAAVTLSVGGNNSNSTYSGALTRSGNLVKVGSGTFTLSGTNTYTGNTTIAAGTLALSGNGSLSSSSPISIASAATFNVSGLASPFTLSSGQSISNSVGTVNGSVGTTAGAAIYPATMGVAGTLTFNGDLNMNAGGTTFFDLSASAASGNDQIAVGGNLMLSSSDTVHINALSGVLSTSDYVLFSVSSGTTMATTPVLVWDGTVPGNSLNYSLVQVGNNVVLRYSSTTAPSVTASVTPTSASRNQFMTVTATVTKGSSNIANVTVDLTQIGGLATAALVLNSAASTPPTYIYTNTFIVSADTALGDKSLTILVMDDSSPLPLTGTYTITPYTISTAAVTWDGGGVDDQWGSNPNWSSDIGPGLVGDSVTFAGNTRLTPDLNANYSVTGVTFDGSAGVFTLGTTTGSTLTNTGGIINNSASPQILNVPVVLGAAQAFNAAAGDLTLNEALNLGNNALSVSGTANTTIGGVVSGAGGVSKSGAGTLLLSRANTYGNNGASDTSVLGGTLAVGDDSALGTSRLNLSGGATVRSADSSARTITNALNFGGSAGANVTFDGTGNLKFTGSAANSSAKTLTVNNPQTEFSGVLSGNSARTVAGTGTLILSGANTYSQGTTINPGSTLQLGNGGASGSLSPNGVIALAGTLVFNRGDALVQGLDFSSAPITGAGSVIQTGPGTTTLNAANAYSGTTAIASGKLVISSAQTGTGAITVADGAKLGITVSGASQLSPTTLTLGSSAATTLEFDGVNSTNIAPVNAGALSVGGQVTVNINSGAFAASNSYPLIRWTGGGPLSASEFVLGNSSGLTATFSVSNSVLYLNVSGATNKQRIVKVYLQAGQSNSDGRALTNGLPVSLLRPQGDVPLYYYLADSGANGDGTLGSLTTLRPGISAFGNGRLFGPELTFGRTLADYYALSNGVSTNIVTVAIIKYARGDTSLVNDWVANGNSTTNGDGPELVVFQQVVNAGLVRLAAAYPGASIELDGMIWTQGEADVGGSSSAANYGKNLMRFINDVRLTYATNQPYGTNMPFFLSRISANQHYMDPADSSYANCLVLRAGQKAITTNLNVFMVDTDPAEFSTLTPYSLPGTHFDTQGEQSLGAAFGRSVIAALPSPKFQLPQKSGDAWTLQFTGVSGALHSVERASSVMGPWTVITNIVIDATGVANFDDPNPLNPAGFYRASRP